MIPITRKELYLNKIVGNNNYETPEKPITPEEFFFAAILGEAVQTPEPLSRYQKYLAKIAGRNISVPKPLTRLELFLAKACGMDIETPTPITREEIFWSNYSAIVDFEVEGVPPLTYKAIEGTLENYRIYGNTVGGESVGDLVESGEHAGEYKVPVVMTAGGSDVTTAIFLPAQLRILGGETEYVDFAERKYHKVRKNLLPMDATSTTIKGVTFTVNADKSVTCNGTNNETSGAIFEFYQSGISLEVDESYIVSGCPEGGKMSMGYTIQYYNGSGWMYEIGYGSTFTVSGSGNVRSRIIISRGVTVNNLTFYPMIRKANIEDDTYEPYIENTEVDVTLPTLPVAAGTNVLSVGTAVQPSKIYVKGKKERE